MAIAARPPVACYHRDARMQVISDADKEHVLPLYMPFKKDTWELSEMGVPFFLHIKYELCSLRAYAIIVSRNRKLVDKHVNFFLLQILGQLQFNGHPSIIIAQIPDTFPQNSILFADYQSRSRNQIPHSR